jgi:predicted HNH restriction endonuclease
VKSKLSKKEIIEDLNNVREKVDGNLTCKKYDEKGNFSSQSAIKKFGKWNDAKRAAGFDDSSFQSFPRNPKGVSREDILKDIERVSKEVKGFVSIEDYKDKGRFDQKTIFRNIGWNEAKEELGLETINFPDGSSKNPMKIEEIKERAVSTITELYEKGEHGVLSKSNRLKTRKQAKRMWSEGTLNSDVFPSGETHPRYKGGGYYYYGPNWDEIAEKIRARDNYKCRRCGKKQSNIEGRSLEVHHIKPFSTFNEIEEANEENNLISLCASCHNKVENLPVRIELVLNND